MIFLSFAILQSCAILDYINPNLKIAHYLLA